MQFQIPQFIEIESKIVGPLTLHQFLYLAGAGFISFVFFFILETWLWFLITAFLAVLALAFAFIKYNNQPLPKLVFLAIIFLWKPRFYLWQRIKEEKLISVPEIPIEEKRKNLKEFFSEMPSVKKLWQDLITTKSPIPKREKAPRTPYWGKKPKESFEIFRKITGEKEIARRVDYR